MTDKEKDAIEDSIEKKYREVTDFYKKLTTEECFYILNDGNKYSTEVKSFALLNLINLIQTQQEEIEKKDRIIEEIIGELANNHCSIRDIVEEEICDDRCIGNNDWTCFKHIKEYFINKVEKESKDDN